MQYALWTLASVAAYIAGLVIIARTTPRLLSHNFDETFFVGLAAIDIVGALLAFGGVVIMFALYNGALPIRILDFLLLVGVFLLALRITISSTRPVLKGGTMRASRIMAAGFSLFLALAAIFCIVQLFTVK